MEGYRFCVYVSSACLFGSVHVNKAVVVYENCQVGHVTKINNLDLLRNISNHSNWLLLLSIKEREGCGR